MSLKRLMISVVRDLLPYAGLDFITQSGMRLYVPDRGAWSSVGEIFISRGYDHYFQYLDGVRRWVDLGCNHGFFSFNFREHLVRMEGSAPNTRVFMGDANEKCVARVQAAIEHNNVQGWKCDRVIVGPLDSFVNFDQHKDSVHSNIFAWGRAHRKFKLATTNITQKFASERDYFDLIKIDIEGAEKFLFQHHLEFLKRFRFGLCEWHGPMFPGTELEEQLRQLKWKVVDFRSSGDQYDLRLGNSWASRFGVVLWENPSPTG
jgi:FkbM family methyltransferase